MFEIPRDKLERRQFLASHSFPVWETLLFDAGRKQYLLKALQKIHQKWPLIHIKARASRTGYSPLIVTPAELSPELLNSRLPASGKLLVTPLDQASSTKRGIIFFDRQGEARMELVNLKDYSELSKGRGTPELTFERKLGTARFSVVKNPGIERLESDEKTGRAILSEMSRQGLLNKMENITSMQPQTRKIWFEFTHDSRRGLRFIEVDYSDK